MNEKMKISEYKGFELWDTPAPEGWRVHQYPVQVTCNGEHVNCFADAHEAMSVIDGMDADTIAYHMRRAPATAPTAAAQGEGVPASVDDLSPAQKEVWVRLALNQADVQIAALEAALQQAQRERDAYSVALNAVFVNVEPALIEVAGIHEENMPSDKRVLFRVFRIVDGALQASAQQAANAEGGA